MSVIVIVGAAVVVLAVMCVAGAVVGQARRRESRRRPVDAVGKSRRRAVAATLEVATAQLPAPALTLRPSEEGNFFERVLGPAAPAIGRLGTPHQPARLRGERATPPYHRRTRPPSRTSTASWPAGSPRSPSSRSAFMLVELTSLPKFYKLLAFLLVTVALAPRPGGFAEPASGGPPGQDPQGPPVVGGPADDQRRGRPRL